MVCWIIRLDGKCITVAAQRTFKIIDLRQQSAKFNIRVEKRRFCLNRSLVSLERLDEVTGLLGLRADQVLVAREYDLRR